MKTTRKNAGKRGGLGRDQTLKRKNADPQPEGEKKVKIDLSMSDEQKQLITMMFKSADEKPIAKPQEGQADAGLPEEKMSVDHEDLPEEHTAKPKSPEPVPPPFAPIPISTPSQPTVDIPIRPPVLPTATLSTPVPDPSKPVSPPSSVRNLEMWTDKYTPKSLRDVVGNKAPIDKVVAWISKWTKADRYKAVLVSGPPGIGKTTTMRLIVRGKGFAAQELNASDLRNKDAVESRLRVASDNRGIAGFKKCSKTAIIMDEIDGMSGGDKGGVAALIDILKATKIPIVCICNDRSCPKLKSLLKHCMDIRFSKPTSQEIATRLKKIAASEGQSIDDNILELIAQSSGLDLRQSVNTLQLHTRGYSWSSVLGSKKDQSVLMNKFQAAARLWSGKELKYSEKLSLFFVDFDFVPMLVQENYLSSMSDLDSMSLAADSIAFGDTIQVKIKTQNDWSLLPVLGQASTLEPVAYARLPMYDLQFPEQLGKMSAQRKSVRIRSEVKDCISPITHISSEEAIGDYAHLLSQVFITTLQTQGKAGFPCISQLLDTYHLSLEAIKANCLEIAPSALLFAYQSIDKSLKSALTKACSKRKQKKTAEKGGKGESSEEESSGAGEEDFKI